MAETLSLMEFLQALLGDAELRGDFGDDPQGTLAAHGLADLTPDDVHVELENGVLTISGERRESSEDRQEGRYHSERSYGAFSRSIALPEGVDEEQVNARFEHGVLEVTVPIPQQRQQGGRRVPIQSGASQRQSGQQSGQQRGGSQQSGAQQGSSRTGANATS